MRRHALGGGCSTSRITHQRLRASRVSRLWPSDSRITTGGSHSFHPSVSRFVGPPRIEPMLTSSGTTVIRNGQLIDGNGGPPVRDGALLIERGRIAFAGPATQ